MCLNNNLFFIMYVLISKKSTSIGCKPQMDSSVFIKVKTECRGVMIESFADYG